MTNRSCELNYIKEALDFFEKSQQGQNTRKWFEDYINYSFYTFLEVAGILDDDGKQYLEQLPKEMQERFEEITMPLIGCMLVHKRDYLGEVYSKLNLNTNQRSQVFTPSYISELMAIALLAQERKTNLIKIKDTTCGTGSLLLGCLQVMCDKAINYTSEAFFYAQDKDDLLAKICYIQVSLAGAPAVIASEDSQTGELRWKHPTLAVLLNDTFIPEYSTKL